MSQILDDFMRQGYSTCALSIPDTDFEDVASAFIDVLELPENELAPLFLYRTPDRRETPLGYTRKNPGYNERGEWRDGKSYFHASLKGELLSTPHIVEYMNRRVEFKTFVEKIHNLARQFEPAARHVLAELEQDYPGWSEGFINDNLIENLQVRINAYDEKADGEIYAIEHADSSGVTLAAWESARGLYFRHGGTSFEAVRRPGHAHVMPGCLFSEWTGKRVAPLLHYVRQPKGVRVTQRVGRMSLVCFVDQRMHPDAVVPSWKETHPNHVATAA